MRHPSDMGASEVRDFLTWLAVHRNVAVGSRESSLRSGVTHFRGSTSSCQRH
ncbi:phage integrase N-terminal SAM-like domain-containing protein [Halomonadaceae bacterium KBTZ08]